MMILPQASCDAVDSQLDFVPIGWDKSHGQKVTEADLDNRAKEWKWIPPNSCNGNCQQGRACVCVKNEDAGGEQWESADAEVLAWLFGGIKRLATWALCFAFAWAVVAVANGLLVRVAEGWK